MQSIVRDPIYVQVNERLRARIGTQFRPGERFLSEREIASEYGVSRATANKALASLVSEGLLQFRKGLGTFVRAATLDGDLHRLVSFTERARQADLRPETIVLTFQSVQTQALEPNVAKLLNASPDESFYCFSRLRLVEGEPMILEWRALPAAHCPNLTVAKLEGSLYALLTEDYELSITGADEELRAIRLNSNEARQLRVKSGSPALEITAIGSMDGEPLWYERTIYRGDRYIFRNQIAVTGPAERRIGTMISADQTVEENES